MSEQSKIIDPAGRCVHAVVKRQIIGGLQSDVWMCSDCKEEFFHLDFTPAKIQVMEPRSTLRDQFAMAALMGQLSSERIPSDEGFKGFADIAELSYKIADKMLEARK